MKILKDFQMHQRCIFHTLIWFDFDFATSIFMLNQSYWKDNIRRTHCSLKTFLFWITAFFTHCAGVGKQAVISKQESFSTTLNRSSIVFTLVHVHVSKYRVYKTKRHLFDFLILGNLLLTFNVTRYLKWKLDLLTLNHIFIIFLWGQA